VATGNYIMKCDDHCMFSKGFDKALIDNSEPHQVETLTRYSLDAVKWERRWEAMEYGYMAYPYVYLDSRRYGIGLFFKKWFGENGNNPKNTGKQEFYYKEILLRDRKIDEIMAIHGSCYFMPAQHFVDIGGLEEVVFKSLYQEPQEIVLKTWLTGGRVVVNKNAWYAHMHKNTDEERGYTLDLNLMRETERFGTAIWMGNKWSGATRPIKWVVEHFWPIPGWPENWEEEQQVWEQKYPIQLEEKYELKGEIDAQCNHSIKKCTNVAVST